MIYVLQAVDGDGRRHELSGVATDEADARRMTTRAAGLIGAVGRPAVWQGGRVTAHDADSRRLVSVARIARGRPT